ncbi:MAG: DUF4861 domain-containing protein [Saprospiraceae bacterium]
MISKRLLIYCLLPLFLACGNTETATTTDSYATSITLKNPLDNSRKDVLLHLNVKELITKFPSLLAGNFKFTGTQDLPFQENDLDGDGITDEIALLVDLKANDEQQINLVPLKEGATKPTFKKRTQAEISHKINGQWKGREYEDGTFKNVDQLRVPPEHTDHSWFIRYEGPGWESDLVGYRFYLDWRNATDIFGKKTKDMVLQQVGQDGFDSYHEPADWGMDVLKVGKSLGIGALGTWTDKGALRVETTDSLASKIVLNGDIESKVQTNYYGWKVGDIKTDVTSNLSIHAGSRLTKHDITLSQALPNLCTGIVQHDKGDLITYENGAWGYIATWGKQSLADDHLGMAVIYKKNDVVEITKDAHSHVVVLKPTNKQLTYYFLAAWEQEPNAIQTKEAFVNYLNQVVLEFGMPLAVSF